MKAALSLTLILALMTSALPAMAQEKRTSAEPSSLARTIAMETARLVVAPQAGSSDVDWSRVRKVKPGTEITVTIRGSQPVKRHFVSAGDTGITVLNVTDPALPDAVKRVLVDTVSNHPEYFDDAQLTRARTFISGNNDVRVVSDGVFVNGQKTADVRQVVETFARNDVIGVEGPASHHLSTGAIVGIVAAIAGVIVLLTFCSFEDCKR